MSKTKGVYRTANQDYPGLTAVTFMVLGYVAFVAFVMLNFFDPLQWMFVALSIVMVFEVARQWVRGYKHWKDHQ
jgi:membrane protein implicated in regulation of membrane protease activity